jgi:hypothetical protein
VLKIGYDIMQLLPALKVNIIIVHPRGVVFPRGFNHMENNIPRVNSFDVPQYTLHQSINT